MIMIRLSLIGFRLVDFFSEKIIAGPHWVPDPPSLAQMTFTQCTSMSELKFDSVAPPGGQIQQYVSFSAEFFMSVYCAEDDEEQGDQCSVCHPNSSGKHVSLSRNTISPAFHSHLPLL